MAPRALSLRRRSGPGSEPQDERYTSARRPTTTAVTRDPVCGMTVDMEKTAHSIVHDGREFGFCSAGCKTKFDRRAGEVPHRHRSGVRHDRGPGHGQADAASTRARATISAREGCQKKFEAEPAEVSEPEPFDPAAGPPAAGRATPMHGITMAHRRRRPRLPGAKWTCPMHPEIVKDGPGDCPICGMALEPMVAVARRRPEPGAGRFHPPLLGQRGAARAAARSSPWAPMLGLPVEQWIGEPLAAGSGAGAGDPGGAVGGAAVLPARSGIRCVNRSPNMWTLIGLGVGAAYLFSVVAVLFPQLFPMEHAP